MGRLLLLLATVVLLAAAACKPTVDDTAIDDDDSAGSDDDDSVQPPDDDDSGATDDDDVTPVDDDDVTPDPACTDGWEPLAILDDFEANIRDYSVDSGSSTLAAITERYLYVYDLSEPRTPVLLETFDVQVVVDPAAEWVAVSAAEGGHVVLGRWQTETGGWAHVQLIDATVGSAALGFETTIFSGEPDESGAVPLATDIAAQGTRSVIVCSWWEESRAYFLGHEEFGVVLDGSRPILGGYWDEIAFAGVAVIHPGSPYVTIVPSEPSIDVVQFPISGIARNPLETEAGWLIPTMGGCSPNQLYLLGDDLSAIEQVGETAMACDEYISDGAHQLAVYEDEIFVANGGGRLLRGDWTPDDWISVEGPSTGRDPSQPSRTSSTARMASVPSGRRTMRSMRSAGRSRGVGGRCSTRT